jgi:hypothetical protein
MTTESGSRTAFATRLVLWGGALCLGLLAAFRAALLFMTWDETHTLLNYTSTLSAVFFLDGANNHPLHSILIMLSTDLFGMGEWSIRLPAVLTGCAYFATSVLIAIRTPAPFAVAAVLTLNPLLFDYFQLARGYGLSALAVLLGVGVHFFTQHRHRFFLACLILTLGSLSIFVAAVATGSFLVVAFLRQWGSKSLPRAHLIGAAGLTSLAALIPVVAMRHVSTPEKPLVAGSGNYFANVLEAFTLSGAPGFLPAMAWALILLPLFFRAAWSQRTRDLFFVTAVCMGLLGILPVLAGTPFPSERVFVPFFPLVLLTAASAWASWLDDSAHKWWWIEAVAAAGLVVAFALGVPHATFLNGQGGPEVRQWVENALKGSGCLPAKQKANPATYYYKVRITGQSGHLPTCGGERPPGWSGP